LRSKLKTRTSRRVYAATFALMLAIPATAVALAAVPTDTQSAIQAKLNRHHVSYGQRVTVSGPAAPARPGQKITLAYAPTGGEHWRALAVSRVRHDGSFRVAAPLRRSGLVKVVGPAPAVSQGVSPGAPPASTVAASSAPHPVTVAAKFALANRSVDVVDGRSAPVSGKLLPAVPGRVVRLEGRNGSGHWRLLSSDRTGRHGGFGLRAKRVQPGQQLRVRFGGDRLNTPSGMRAGETTVFHQAVASWYNDGGNTACGFHAFYGVANVSLPCGTKVTFRNGSHEVTATVDDRGPYVGGRTWDLNQNLAAALGFGGVGTVLASR
jgi:hypothetical protein